MKLHHIVMASLLIATPAHATKQRFTAVDPGCNVIMPCEGVVLHPRGVQIAKKVGFGSAVPVYDRGAVIGGRPSGCPHAFCGCGASIYLFGKIIPHLNLAANWLRFPRTAPAPRMAAARRGHVMVLVEHKGGSIWRVYDANSGRGLTRLHDRSIAGYVVVNPHG